MASESRLEAPPVEAGAEAPLPEEEALDELEKILGEDPWSFEFFQAVRLLRRLHPASRGVGEFAAPDREVARFSTNPGLGFPSGEIHELELEDSEPARMAVNFLGLVGNKGVLPLHYSRMVRRGEKPEERSALRDFLDIFQHRLISLFYRAWEKSRFYVPFERGQPDPLSSRIFDLLGLGGPHLRGRMDIPDESLLFYPQLLGPRQRTAWGLERLLEDYLEVPVEVEQFVGGWYPLSKDAQLELDDEPGPSAPGLGLQTIVGDEIWDPQARVRIRLGPLPRDRYEDFLPGRKGHRAVRALTEFFSNGQYDFEIQLVLARDDTPPLELGKEEEPTPLGWLTWLRTRPMSRDPDETTLTL
jgi:type VI secretion system protein ImpH